MRQDRLFTAKAAAAAYFEGKSPRWVRELARKGAFGDLVRLGYDWLIPESGIQTWIRKHTVAFNPELGIVPDPLATPKRLANLLPFRK